MKFEELFCKTNIKTIKINNNLILTNLTTLNLLYVLPYAFDRKLYE